MSPAFLITVLLGTATFCGVISADQKAEVRDSDSVMLVAVSRDESMLAGGISSSKPTARGVVHVEPIARLSATGAWTDLPCTGANQKNCVKFEHDYLSKPHVYSIVSGNGRGATIRSKPTALSECYDYIGTGTYTGTVFENSAIASDSPDMFADAKPIKQLSEQDSLAVRVLMTKLVPKKLDSIEDLRVFEVELEGRSFYVVQRAFSDIPADERRQFVFAIGVVIPHAFEILHWKQNTEDEIERVLGTTTLKSGREFMISVVNHPEGHFYRVYGIRKGNLALLYTGGGSSC